MATYTLTATKDAYIVQAFPDTNYGSGNTVFLIGSATQADRVVMGFQLTGAPIWRGFVSATLRLYFVVGSSAFEKTVDVCKLSRTDWVEAEVTWNSYSSGNAWTSAGGDFVESDPAKASTVMPTAYSQFVEWDVTEIVRDAITNGIDPNFLIKFATNEGSCQFTSKDSSNEANRPQLVIETNDVVTLYPVQDSAIYPPATIYPNTGEAAWRDVGEAAPGDDTSYVSVTGPVGGYFGADLVIPPVWYADRTIVAVHVLTISRHVSGADAYVKGSLSQNYATPQALAAAYATHAFTFTEHPEALRRFRWEDLWALHPGAYMACTSGECRTAKLWVEVEWVGTRSAASPRNRAVVVIRDGSGNTLAYAPGAFNIGTSKKINELGSMQFSVPADFAGRAYLTRGNDAWLYEDGVLKGIYPIKEKGGMR